MPCIKLIKMQRLFLCLDSNQSPGKNNKTQQRINQEEEPDFHNDLQTTENIRRRWSYFDYPGEFRFRRNRNKLNICSVLT